MYSLQLQDYVTRNICWQMKCKEEFFVWFEVRRFLIHGQLLSNTPGLSVGVQSGVCSTSGRVQPLSCSSEAAALLPHSLNRRRLATPHRQFGGNVPTSGTLGETRLRHFSYHITVLPAGKRVVGAFSSVVLI